MFSGAFQILSQSINRSGNFIPIWHIYMETFDWRNSNPESLDRYVLMICDLRSPSSVYCCNRREVVPLWPLWLCRRDTSCPHQASEAAHRSVRLPLLLAIFSLRWGVKQVEWHTTAQIIHRFIVYFIFCCCCFCKIYVSKMCIAVSSSNCFWGRRRGYFCCFS